MITQAAPIRTWLGIGGGAERYAEPTTPEELSEAVRADPDLRVLGDGANLLVHDEGVAELVVRMRGELARWSIDPKTALVRAGAGASLPRLVLETVRAGLAGLEGLGGIPATVGGAAVMNAGGRFGEIADRIETVHAIGRTGERIELAREEIDFGYRCSGLHDLIITSVDFRLEPTIDARALRDTLKRIMANKKRTQPLGAKSCGCVFKNPTLGRALADIGQAGDRVGAGLLIDRAGGKGLRSASRHVRVSDVHANFFETAPGARAADVIELIDRVRELVGASFGVRLETELVIWRRNTP